MKKINMRNINNGILIITIIKYIILNNTLLSKAPIKVHPLPTIYIIELVKNTRNPKILSFILFDKTILLNGKNIIIIYINNNIPIKTMLLKLNGIGFTNISIKGTLSSKSPPK